MSIYRIGQKYRTSVGQEFTVLAISTDHLILKNIAGEKVNAFFDKTEVAHVGAFPLKVHKHHKLKMRTMKVMNPIQSRRCKECDFTKDSIGCRICGKNASPLPRIPDKFYPPGAKKI